MKDPDKQIRFMLNLAAARSLEVIRQNNQQPSLLSTLVRMYEQQHAVLPDMIEATALAAAKAPSPPKVLEPPSGVEQPPVCVEPPLLMFTTNGGTPRECWYKNGLIGVTATVLNRTLGAMRAKQVKNQAVWTAEIKNTRGARGRLYWLFELEHLLGTLPKALQEVQDLGEFLARCAVNPYEAGHTVVGFDSIAVEYTVNGMTWPASASRPPLTPSSR